MLITIKNLTIDGANDYVVVRSEDKRGWNVPVPGMPAVQDKGDATKTRPYAAKDLLKAVMPEGMSPEWANFVRGYILPVAAKPHLQELCEVLTRLPGSETAAKAVEAKPAKPRIDLAALAATLVVPG